jgi:hypothetical protein
MIQLPVVGAEFAESRLFKQPFSGIHARSDLLRCLLLQNFSGAHDQAVRQE